MAFIWKIIRFMTLISFMFVGLQINLLQLILILMQQLSNKPDWRRFIKRMNAKLFHVLISPLIMITYNCFKFRIHSQLKDGKLLEMPEKPSVVLLLINHAYTVDILVFGLVFACTGQIDNLKTISFKSLKLLPGLGWAMWMSDFIIVDKDWQKDRPLLKRKLNQLYIDYPQVILGLFAESGYWTRRKREASLEFAKSRGIEPFKYHAIPRTKGFNYTLRHYLRYKACIESDEKQVKIFNLQFIMPDRPTIIDWFDGRHFMVDIYCEEVAIPQAVKDEALKSRDETECPEMSKLLFDIYRRKDQLMEDYEEGKNRPMSSNQKFGSSSRIRPPFSALIVWILGLIGTYALPLYLTYTNSFLSAPVWTILASLVVFIIWLFKVLLVRVEK